MTLWNIPTMTTNTWTCRCGYVNSGRDQHCLNCMTDRNDLTPPKPTPSFYCSAVSTPDGAFVNLGATK